MGLPGGADLATTPLSAPENHYYRLRGTSELEENGTLKGKFTLELEGQSDAVMRRMFTRSYKSEWQAFLESQLLKTEPGLIIKDITYGNPYDYSDPFLLSVTYEVPHYGMVSESYICFTPLTAQPLFKHRYLNDHFFKNTELTKRSYAFYTRCSKLIDIREEINLPQHASALHIPAAVSNEGSGAGIRAEYKLEESTLSFSQQIMFKKRIYHPDDWPSYRQAVLEQQRLANQRIILKLK
jgi:hypothetical protein